MTKKSTISLLLALCLLLGACPVFGSSDEVLKFTDVPEGHWAYKYVSEMTSMGLFGGTSQPVDGVGTFSPDAKMTRGAFLTVTVNQLYRSEFASMAPANPWYKNAYDLAVGKGIISSSEFSLNDMAAPMTRQEMAMVLVRAMEIMGNLSTELLMPEHRIPDAAAIGSKYKVYVQKCYANGCIGGTDSKGTFSPQGVLTRAQASVVLYHLVVPESRAKYDESGLVKEPLYAYLTDRRVVVDGKPYSGVVRIGDRYYYPVANSAFTDGASQCMNFCYYGTCYGKDETELLGYLSLGRPYAVSDWEVAPAAVGKNLGLAQQCTAVQGVNYYYDDKLYDSYTLGGRYLMVAVEALGEGSFQGRDYVITDEDAIFKMKDAVVNHDLSSDIATKLIKGSDRETLKAIHDYVVNTLNYDHKEGYGEVYSTKLPINETITQKKGVCADYATLTLALCRAAGIPCLFVDGYASEGHQWNRVYLDGSWYFMDCTWDDPIGGKPGYSYFLISADKLAKDHYWESGSSPWDTYDYPMPREYDPAWEQLDPMNVKGADMYRKVLCAQLAIAYREGKSKFSIKCSPGSYCSPSCAYPYGLIDYMTWSYNSKTGCYDYRLDRPYY